MNSTSGSSACTLSAIEHSVTITTRLGLFLRTQSIMCAVEPVKSDAAITSGGHSGCAMICTDGIVGADQRQFVAGEALMHLA